MRPQKVYPQKFDYRISYGKIVILLLLPIIFISFYVYFFRFLYTKTYDREYLNNLYDHSQYSIAASTRSIGDEAVYQVIGERLVQGKAGIYSYDPQVPPFGKTLIGLSIYFFNNGYILNIFTGLLSFYALVVIAYLITKSFKRTFLAIFIFGSDPLFIWQYKQTMLDLPQLCLLLWHITLLLLAFKVKPQKWGIIFISISSIFLGLFSSVKFGLMVPIIFLTDFLFVFFFSQNLGRQPEKAGLLKIFTYTGLFFSGFIIGFFLGHIQFFLNKGSVLDFLKNEKWVFLHWFGNKVPSFPALPLIVFITGWYRHLTRDIWERVSEWSIMWPLLTLTFLASLLKFKKGISAVKPEIIYLMLLSGLFIAVFSFIPFYVRYLLILIPQLVIIFVAYLPKIFFNKFFQTVFILVVISRFLLSFFDQPDGTVQLAKMHIRNKSYQDLYSILVNTNETRLSYWNRLFEYEDGAKPLKTDLEIYTRPTGIWENSIFFPYRLTYYSGSDSFSVKGEIHLLRYGHAWFIDWMDNYLHPDYEKGDKLTVVYDHNVRYGNLILEDGRQITMQPKQVPHLRLYSEKITDEKDTLSKLMILTGKSDFDLLNLYKTNHPAHLPAELGELKENVIPVDNRLIDKANMEIYYVTQYPRLSEKYPQFSEYDEIIKPVIGKKVLLRKASGRQIVLLDIPPRDGKDIVVN